MLTSLCQLLLELTSNALYVPITLGGGAHEFIGIILSPFMSPLQPFVAPIHPDTLRNQHGTWYKIILATALHTELLHNFQAYQLVQRLLVQQVL